MTLSHPMKYENDEEKKHYKTYVKMILLTG